MMLAFLTYEGVRDADGLEIAAGRAEPLGDVAFAVIACLASEIKGVVPGVELAPIIHAYL